MLFLRRYQDANTFLAETRQELEVYEVEHSFPIWAASVLARDTLKNSYCGAVFNGSKLVFATVAFDQGNAFTTVLMDKTVEAREAIKMLVDDIYLAPVVVRKILGESNLTFVKEAWHGQIDLNSKVWSYIFTRDDLPPLSNKEDGTFFLRQTTTVELPLLIQWTAAFTNDSGLVNTYDEDGYYFLCAQEIQEGNAYFWCHPGKGPVAMIWKRRPLNRGCSIGYVYTPPIHRGRGYGGAMVLAFTSLLLEEFTYTTLLVDAKQDPKDNMYTRVGYRLVGERYEYRVSN
ncbi:hypothetical protein BJV82DRAFT_71372 [Fennellomyces sp. T-0311]|nr:hypothetical protein BJV82DRAFT_71372 [Fennellomyces sp. T-0311]